MKQIGPTRHVSPFKFFVGRPSGLRVRKHREFGKSMICQEFTDEMQQLDDACIKALVKAIEEADREDE